MSDFIEMILGCSRTSLTCETCAGDRARETAVSALQARQVHLDWMREPAAGSLGRAGWVRIELAPHAAKRYIALGDLKGKKVGTQKELSLTTAEPR